jgi:hypothetical protein
LLACIPRTAYDCFSTVRFLWARSFVQKTFLLTDFFQGHGAFFLKNICSKEHLF